MRSSAATAAVLDCVSIKASSRSARDRQREATPRRHCAASQPDGDGATPASVVRDLEDTLTALEPKAPVSDWDLRQALKTLAEPEPTLQPRDEDDDPFSSPEQALRRAQADRERARCHILRNEEWRKSRDAALARFNQFGGSVQFKDAKDNWDDTQA